MCADRAARFASCYCACMLIDDAKDAIATLTDDKLDWRDVRAFAALLGILAVLALEVADRFAPEDAPAPTQHEARSEGE